jgi:hypothetical protein
VDFVLLIVKGVKIKLVVLIVLKNIILLVLVETYVHFAHQIAITAKCHLIVLVANLHIFYNLFLQKLSVYLWYKQTVSLKNMILVPNVIWDFI